jgi:RimJ/RimL family protein N-acetyltransferase
MDEQKLHAFLNRFVGDLVATVGAVRVGNQLAFHPAREEAPTPRSTVRPPPQNDRRVVIRALEPGETAPLLEIFAGLGARSRELRFLAPKSRLSAADLHQLTNVDGHDRVALVAQTLDGHPIGIARFARDRDQKDFADVAVAVVDAWQGRGVGTRLYSALTTRGQQVGIRHFSVTMARRNQAARRLMRRGSGEVRPVAMDHATAEFTVTLPEPGSPSAAGQDHLLEKRDGQREEHVARPGAEFCA